MGYSAIQTLSFEQIAQAPQLEGAIGLWRFDGNGQDPAGGWDLETNSFVFQPLQTIDTPGLFASNESSGNNRTGLITDPGFYASNGQTVAMWAIVYVFPGGNYSLAGMRLTGSGATYNFPWAMDVQAAGTIRFYWQSGTKVGNQVTSSQAIPLQTWLHIVGTRDDSGTIGRFYVNGELDAEATGQNPPNPGVNQRRVLFCTNGGGATLQAGISGVQVLPYELGADDVRQLYNNSKVTI